MKLTPPTSIEMLLLTSVERHTGDELAMYLWSALPSDVLSTSVISSPAVKTRLLSVAIEAPAKYLCALVRSS